MSQRQTPPEIDLETLLERGRSIERLPESVRARALARARAFAASPPVLHLQPSKPRTGSMIRGFGAAAAVAVVAAIAAAFTLRGPSPHGADTPPAAPTSPASCPAALPSAQDSLGLSGVPEPSVPTPSTLPTPSAPPTPPRGDRTDGARESAPTELALLRRAHAAYAARDFGRALVLVSEQARRFPNGALAEEREALRVRSLAAAGRTGEAGRAATAFAKHFPRSVLLPQIQQLRVGNP